MAEDQESEQKRCIACGEWIYYKASKCKECGSFQNWRRFMALSNTTLALIIALVSVLSVAIPAIRKAFEVKYEHVIVELLGDLETVKTQFVVTNIGTEHGIVDGFVIVEVEHEGERLGDSLLYLVTNASDPKELIIRPGEVKIFEWIERDFDSFNATAYFQQEIQRMNKELDVSTPAGFISGIAEFSDYQAMCTFRYNVANAGNVAEGVTHSPCFKTFRPDVVPPPPPPPKGEDL